MKMIVLISMLTLANFAGAQEIERINPEGMTQPTAYSHLVKHGDLMFIAGQVALDGEGNVIGEGDMLAQYRQALENLKTVLASEGADSVTSSRSRHLRQTLTNFARQAHCAESFLGTTRRPVRSCRSNGWRDLFSWWR